MMNAGVVDQAVQRQAVERYSLIIARTNWSYIGTWYRRRIDATGRFSSLAVNGTTNNMFLEGNEVVGDITEKENDRATALIQYAT